MRLEKPTIERAHSTHAKQTSYPISLQSMKFQALVLMPARPPSGPPVCLPAEQTNEISRIINDQSFDFRSEMINNSVIVD